jgi:hypothetical protein
MCFIVYEECSNHGECNYRSGQCLCEHGFHGPACDDTEDSKVNNIYTYICTVLFQYDIVTYEVFRTSSSCPTMDLFSQQIC